MAEVNIKRVAEVEIKRVAQVKWRPTEWHK
jgi:hypothetical protein